MPSRVPLNITAQLNPATGEVEFFEFYKNPFRAAHNVLNLYATAAWVARVRRRLFLIYEDHFFDDHFLVEPQVSITQRCGRSKTCSPPSASSGTPANAAPRPGVDGRAPLQRERPPQIDPLRQGQPGGHSRAQATPVLACTPRKPRLFATGRGPLSSTRAAGAIPTRSAHKPGPSSTRHAPPAALHRRRRPDRRPQIVAPQRQRINRTEHLAGPVASTLGRPCRARSLRANSS